VRRPAIAVLLISSACGCEPEPPEPPLSSDLATGEIALFAEIRSNGGLAQAFVTPLHGSGVVELSGGDALRISAEGGPEQALAPIDGTRLGEYAAQIETGAAVFEVILARSAERVASAVDLPPPFALSGPPGPAPRSEPIAIAWDPGNGAYMIHLEVGGPCFPTWFSRTFEEDPGGYEIQPADLAAPAGDPACELVVEVTREVSITPLAPELAPSSRARGLQIRALSISTVP